MWTKGLLFENTCGGMPEIWKVYDTDASYKFVAFIKLTDGKLTCDFITGKNAVSNDLESETIYTKKFEYDYQGEFENEEQRSYYLDVMADKIFEKIQIEDSAKEQKCS